MTVVSNVRKETTSGRLAEDGSIVFLVNFVLEEFFIFFLFRLAVSVVCNFRSRTAS
jgi:hypothetical protein